MNPSSPTTVAALREKLAGLPDTDAVVLCNADEHTTKRVVNHITHDRHTKTVVLHLEETVVLHLEDAVAVSATSTDDPIILEDA